jgi:hypothetical protein
MLGRHQPAAFVARTRKCCSTRSVQHCFTWGINSDLLDLPIHDGLLFQRGPIGGRRLFCMLGGTLADLENEPRFFQHSLVGARPGDMLLLDIPLHKEDCDIQTPTTLPPLHRAWFSGIIQRHCPDAIQLGFQLSQPSQGMVPGSQIREVLATVTVKGQADRTFSMYRTPICLSRPYFRRLRCATRDSIGITSALGFAYVSLARSCA